MIKNMNAYCDANTKKLFFGVLKYSGFHDFNIKAVEASSFDTLRVNVVCNYCGRSFKIYMPINSKITKNNLLKGTIKVDPSEMRTEEEILDGTELQNL